MTILHKKVNYTNKNVSEYNHEYISEYSSKYVSEYISEYISECTSECTSDYVREYISEYVSEYTSEYISEYIGKCGDLSRLGVLEYPSFCSYAMPNAICPYAHSYTLMPTAPCPDHRSPSREKTKGGLVNGGLGI